MFQPYRCVYNERRKLRTSCFCDGLSRLNATTQQTAGEPAVRGVCANCVQQVESATVVLLCFHFAAPFVDPSSNELR